MDKTEYSRIKPIIYQDIKSLEKNDFDTFFETIKNNGATPAQIAEIYIFFAEELKMDPINYMTVIPKNFFSTIPVVTITLPSNIELIEDGAFQNNKHLEKVEISRTSKIEDIPIDCFSGCTNLEEVHFGPLPTLIHEGSFDGCNKVQIYVINNDVRVAAGVDPRFFAGRFKKVGAPE